MLRPLGCIRHISPYSNCKEEVLPRQLLSLELPICGRDSRVVTSLDTTTLTSPKVSIAIYHPYPHNFHFFVRPLTLISHTSFSNALPRVTLEPCIRIFGIFWPECHTHLVLCSTSVIPKHFSIWVAFS